MIKVKVCGITNAQDALWAANLGADFIGLNFYPQSPRKVSAKHAKEIAQQIPPFVATVGIFVNEPLEAIKKLIASVPLKVVQLHGDETPEMVEAVKALGVKVIKAFRLQGPIDPVMLSAYAPHVDFFMFDTFSPDSPGGTGQAMTFEWLQGVEALGKPWFLAGGLKPDTVAAAIKQAKPSAVDVASGIEKSPTRKDYDAMKNFIQSAKATR
jgi:phosphoribosylanthranilate isomerase